MNKTSNLNKVVDVVFGILLITAMMLFSNGSIIVYAACPVLLALVYFLYGGGKYLTILIGASMMGLLFTDIKSVSLNALVLLIISLSLVIIIKSDAKDKRQILVSTIITSLLAIIIYRLTMISDGLSISSMAKELKESMEIASSYNLDIKTYEQALSMWPGVIVGLCLLYSTISLKVIRNYLAFKNLGSDMKSLNTIRITKKDAIIFVILAVISYIILTLLGINGTYVSSNIIWIGLVLLFLNGLSVYDFILVTSRSAFNRGVQWFFMIIFFSFFAIMLSIFGLVDIFLDIRKKVRRPNADK